MALLYPFTSNLTPHPACVASLADQSGLGRAKSITAKRMISGLVLKYLNGECFHIGRGYETAQHASSSFCLTIPSNVFAPHERTNCVDALGLALDEWRPLFNERHTGDNQSSKNTAFARARKDLVDKGLLECSDDTYRLAIRRHKGDIVNVVKCHHSHEATRNDTPL